MVLDHILRTNDILDKLILLFSWWCLYLKLISEALYWVIHHSRASTIKLTIELYLSFAELADHLRRFSRQQITSYTLVWLQCGLNSGVPADIHCAPHVPFSGWHCLEVIVSPAFLILAQMSLYLLFPQHDFFLSFFFFKPQGLFADSSVDYGIILKHHKNIYFLLLYLRLTKTSAGPDKYICF